MTIGAQVAWATGADATEMGTSGYSADDLTEIAMNVGLLGEAIPDVLGRMTFLVDDSDPLAELQTMAVPEGAVQPLARLLLVERLVGGRRASAVERFSLGPARGGERQLELSWWEPRRYSNVEPRARSSAVAEGGDDGRAGTQLAALFRVLSALLPSRPPRGDGPPAGVR